LWHILKEKKRRKILKNLVESKNQSWLFFELIPAHPLSKPLHTMSLECTIIWYDQWDTSDSVPFLGLIQLGWFFLFLILF